MDVNLTQYERIYNHENFSADGLKDREIKPLLNRYGENKISQSKKMSLFKRIIKALCEPMILILIFAWIITFGINLGNILSGKEADFYECIGVFCSIAVSVGLTVFMESKSEKAFELLKKFSDNIMVTVQRDGVKKLIGYKDVCVGDVIFLQTGDKIIADGLIIDCDCLEAEESTLSGESRPITKKRYSKGHFSTENMLYSGTYVKSGNAKILVLAVGDKAQIGKIAQGISDNDQVSAPLAQKLNKLSKTISVFGGISAFAVFVITLCKLYLTNQLAFESIKNAFMQAIILIVAAVPEGLPTTVAIALALSVVRLAKSNAVIKKLVAAETVGCVSVICSDKTGTLTLGKMEVNGFVVDGKFEECQKLNKTHIINNVAYNSTAIFINDGKEIKSIGNSTEQALINALFKKNTDKLSLLREGCKILSRQPFSSEKKFMSTSIIYNGEKIDYLKGSIEKIVELCSLNEAEKGRIYTQAKIYEDQAQRIIAFAHSNGSELVYDGFAVISDNVRKEVHEAVSVCKKAGISIKILTGDNKETAVAIAKKLSLRCKDANVLTGSEVENLTDAQLKEALRQVTVVARSTPEIKLRVVRLLKEMGEVVAVTGDGVNDAPAIKNADIGIAMGDGSDITKEASDIILIDNSFAVIVKAVAFGRNIYRNFQRFLFFQLTVNFSAVAVVLAFLALGFDAPFTALQLLWINIIMDGPLALSLGLERREDDFMGEKPVKRTDAIVTGRMFARIIIHSVIIAAFVVAQRLYNFLGVSETQCDSAVFSIFVLFQLFNAVNARETGSRSVLRSLGKNKLFSCLFIFTLVMQIIIAEFLCAMFSTVSLGVIGWIKIVLTGLSIIVLSEAYKFLYKRMSKSGVLKKISKRSKFA